MRSAAEGDTRNSVWSVRNRCAAIRAYAVSSYAASPSKPMVNVFTGVALNRLMRPTTIVESRPPLRNAPSGTSLTSRRSTGRVVRSRKRDVPVAPRGLATVGLQRHDRPGLEPPHVLVERGRTRHVPVKEVV